MKKTLSLILLLALAGCGSNATSSSTAASSSTTSQEAVSSAVTSSSETVSSSVATSSSETVSSSVATSSSETVSSTESEKEAKVTLTPSALSELTEATSEGVYPTEAVESTVGGYTFLSSQTFGIVNSTYEAAMAEIGCFQLKKNSGTIASIENKTAIEGITYIDVNVVSTYEYSTSSIPTIYTGEGFTDKVTNIELIDSVATGSQNSKGFDISIYTVRYSFESTSYFKLANETSYAEYVSSITLF